MTPKEKAAELFNKMLDKAYEVDCLGGEYMIAKRCAIVAVDELLTQLVDDDLYIEGETNINYVIEYWGKVKQEIEKL